MDGGFASKKNLKELKIHGVSKVCFSKRRDMKTEDMCSSKKVYRKLWKFRAGVEGIISWRQFVSMIFPLRGTFGHASSSEQTLSEKSVTGLHAVLVNSATLD